MKSIRTHLPKTGKSTSGYEAQALILEKCVCNAAGGMPEGVSPSPPGKLCAVGFLGVCNPGVSVMLLLKQQKKIPKKHKSTVETWAPTVLLGTSWVVVASVQLSTHT